MQYSLLWRARVLSRAKRGGAIAHLQACHRLYATVSELSKHSRPGEQLHGFILKKAREIPELQLTAFHLQHNRSGSDYLHIARDDKNNVFSIGFKTNPPDNTGVPHILEHTTLCGSQRYPVRDPFFKMLPRSLSNFMNAYTSSDHTSYPFATTNHKDFNNLMSVYLDATLNPLLKENDFIQEGWRIGPKSISPAAAESPSNDESNLVFKGVVYNEMKGQMSDASYLYYIKFHEHIFPDLNNSGGDPQDMTGLTHRFLQRFHREHYHPSNAKIFTYGDMPLSDHLMQLDQMLSTFERRNLDAAILSPQDLENGPLNLVTEGPVDPLVDLSTQFKTSTSWLMGESSDIQESFALGILSSLLLDGYGSPMYEALVEAGLGSDFTPNTGYDTSARRGILSIGLNGVKETDVPKVKEAIQSKLGDIHQKGFEKHKIEGLLHQLELVLKHKTANFGLGLIQRLEPGWFNGTDPFDALAWNETIESFKNRVAEGAYLESLLEKYLLNDRTLTFTMKPSESYTEERRSEENARLTTKLKEAEQALGGNKEAYHKFARQEKALIEEQSDQQDLSCLPTLQVKDITRISEKKAIHDSSIGSVKVQWREASTNGLTYFRGINYLEGLPADLRMLIPLYTAAIMRIGTKKKSVEELEDLIKLKTGGIGISYHANPIPNNSQLSMEGISLSAYALDKNVPTMFELLRSILQETNFDGPLAESHIRQLLQQETSGALDAVASAGHSYASRYAQAGLSIQGALNEQTSGLTQLQYMASLAERSPHQGLHDIIQKLKEIQNIVVANSETFRAAITCASAASSANEKTLKAFMSEFPTSSHIPNSTPLPKLKDFTTKTFFPLPYQVYYSSLALPTTSYTNSSGAPLQILAQLLTHKHLHREIREKGGAYGGGASSRDLSGIFNFYSYRDPDPQNALRIMSNAGTWARDGNWTTQDLNEAKLSTFQSIDAPQSMSDEGMFRFLSGVSEEMEQTKRNQLLDVTKEDVKEVAQQFLVDGMKDARVTLLGEQNDWATENTGWSLKKVELEKPSEFAGASDLSPGDLPVRS